MRGRSVGHGRRTLALLLLLATGACNRAPSPSAGPGADPDAPSRAREGALDLLLVESPAMAGSTDWVPVFEQASGCKVRVHSAASSAALLALAENADVDAVLANGDVAASLVAAGRVRALAAKRIATFGPLPAPLRALPGTVVDGVAYGLPVRWQPNVLGYDTGDYPEPPGSWSVLYAPAGDAAGAPMLAPSEPIAIADAAIYLAATRPELRIADPYALDERQYAATLALLRQRLPQGRGGRADLAGQAEGLRNGVSVFVTTPAQVRALQAQDLPVAWTTPAEGLSAQVEVAMLHAQARHPNCAGFWLDWTQLSSAQALLAARSGALPVRAEACASAALGNGEACTRDGYALMDSARFWRVPHSRCGNRRCVPYSRWTRDYLALRGE